MDFTKIFQLKGLKSKNKDGKNFYECCDLTKKVLVSIRYISWFSRTEVTLNCLVLDRKLTWFNVVLFFDRVMCVYFCGALRDIYSCQPEKLSSTRTIIIKEKSRRKVRNCRKCIAFIFFLFFLDTTKIVTQYL